MTALLGSGKRGTWLHSIGLAVAGIGAATVLFWLVRDLFGEGDLALMYLPVVALVAAVGDMRSGACAAALAFFAAKFFLWPPYYTLSSNDPKDWLSLVVSLLIGLAMGIQSQRMRRREDEATWLYRFSASLSMESTLEGLVDLLHRMLPQAVLVLPGDPVPPGLREVPLRGTHGVEGTLYVAALNDRLMTAVASLTAAFLQRLRLQTAAAQAEGVKEADRLKSVLVSSVSHELRTPLASVTATMTNLLESDATWDREQLVRACQDLQRLNDGIGALLDLSRLESGTWVPTREQCELGEVVGTVLKRIPQPARSRIQTHMPADLPTLELDYAQWVRALQNLLENALAYSPADAPVSLSAAVEGQQLQIHVDDRGPGVAADERERVFEKFYRGTHGAVRPAGSGLGLAITRDIVESHGGRVWIEDGPAGGARFTITLEAAIPCASSS
ncbi:MAG: sensor histidine kinase [Candidatus Xenobia bacterium]